MAGILLDRIINQTLHSSFGGSVNLFQDPLLPHTVVSNEDGFRVENNHSSNTNHNNNAAQMSVEQFDSMTFALQNIEMSNYERLFWIVLFSLMVLVAVGGNTIVVYIVSTNKEMKSVTNYFLVNLSLADTMVSTLNVVFNLISMLISHWPFGKMYCKISNFIAILSISASVFTLTAISCDRYNAIIHPLRPRMSHSHALAWILLIWTLSSALALPNAIYSTLVEDRLMNENVAITCTMVWPDGRYPLSSHDHIYNIIILVVTYLVPILTMAILYYKVGKELWGSEAIGENIDKQQRALMAKKKIVKMMIVVVIIFALCWLPYHAFFVVNYYVPTIFQDVPLHYQRCYLIMYWMAMSNSMYNPIIIYFMNSNFRKEFRKILLFICCCRTYTPVARSTTTINNQITNNRTALVAKRQLVLEKQHNHNQQARRLINNSTLVANNDNPNQSAASQMSDIDVETILVSKLDSRPNDKLKGTFDSEITTTTTIQPLIEGALMETEPFINRAFLSSHDRNDDLSIANNNNNNNSFNIKEETNNFKVWI